MKNYLDRFKITNEIMDAIKFMDDGPKRLCLDLITDYSFQTAPGGKTRHHDYESGLIEHTQEVLMTCLRLGTLLGHEGKQIVATAAIFHDYGKIYEFWLEDDGTDSGKEIVTSRPWKKMIGHVAFSYHHWMEVSKLLHPTIVYQVAHCILSHHGRREWGSPAEPQTEEAHILHIADMMSMQAQGREDKK